MAYGSATAPMEGSIAHWGAVSPALVIYDLNLSRESIYDRAINNKIRAVVLSLYLLMAQTNIIIYIKRLE